MMGEKRFRCAVSEDIIRHMPYIVLEHNKKLYKIDKVVELLNLFDEENKKLQIEVKELNRKYNAFYDATNKRLSEMLVDYLIQPYKDKNMKLEEDLLFYKEMKKILEQTNKQLREENEEMKIALKKW